MDDWTPIITGLIALIGVLVVGYFTYKRGKQSDKVTAEANREANAITFSGQLLVRLDKLEEKVEEQDAKIERLGRVFKVSLNFIERFLLWAHDGSKPPIPDVPGSLQEHLDPHLMDEHNRQQDRLNPSDAEGKA